MKAKTLIKNCFFLGLVSSFCFGVKAENRPKLNCIEPVLPEEKLICQTPSLLSENRELEELYKRLRAGGKLTEQDENVQLDNRRKSCQIEDPKRSPAEKTNCMEFETKRLLEFLPVKSAAITFKDISIVGMKSSADPKRLREMKTEQNGSTCIHYIDLYRDNEIVPMQTISFLSDLTGDAIEDCTYSNPADPGSEFIDISDYNFDPYPDFAVRDFGASGAHNSFVRIFLYDPVEHSYNWDLDFPQPITRMDKKNRILTAGGGTIHQGIISKYKFDNGKRVLISRVTSTWLPDFYEQKCIKKKDDNDLGTHIPNCNPLEKCFNVNDESVDCKQYLETREVFDKTGNIKRTEKKITHGMWAPSN